MSGMHLISSMPSNLVSIACRHIKALYVTLNKGMALQPNVVPAAV